MRYEGKIYRPPSEADSLIVQATIGCSWNHCTYCDMYREKTFRVRDLKDTLGDLKNAAASFGSDVEKIFIADGDALILPMDHWISILEFSKRVFPNLRRVSCYAMARNVLEKSEDDLKRLRALGLSLLYLGPESGDDATLKKIAKGDTAERHVDAAKRARVAGMQQSVIVLLGIDPERSEEHARATGELITRMDPEFFSALTVTVVPGTPLATLESRGKYKAPNVEALLQELRTMIASANPTRAVFRTNHASNYLPLAGELPRDRDALLRVIDRALAGEIALRPERMRAL